MGDKNKSGIRRKLAVDGYFPKYNLIVEYLERQHFESVKIMDRRMTISGVTRDKQRRIYHKRRKQFAIKNGYNYLELAYMDFEHYKNGKLKRIDYNDESVIKEKLKTLKVCGF